MMQDPNPDPEEANASKKLARIRDNQRRSRAKRQEHMRDLEQKIAACHSACRETDMLRQAVDELRRENAVLRELLVGAGVEGHVVDSAVACRGGFTGGGSGFGDGGGHGSHGGAKEVVLKPKLATNGGGGVGDRGGCGLGCSKEGEASSLRNEGAVATALAIGSRSHVEDLDWLFENDPEAQAKANAFCNEALQEGPASTDDLDGSDSVLCSVAKDMIEQYDVSPEEMIATKQRLAGGFCLPSGRGGGCRIRNETLFEVLKDLGSKYP
jgi:hypothetical protein